MKVRELRAKLAELGNEHDETEVSVECLDDLERRVSAVLRTIALEFGAADVVLLLGGSWFDDQQESETVAPKKPNPQGPESL